MNILPHPNDTDEVIAAKALIALVHTPTPASQAWGSAGHLAAQRVLEAHKKED